MLSLPLIVPHDDLWRNSANRPTPYATPAAAAAANNQNNLLSQPHAQAQAQANRQVGAGVPTFRSQLALLTADENAIEQRKLNVRRFGAAWLRPPGVAKTFQARMDEEQERAEQAEMARREAQMLELASAAEAEAAGMDGEGEGEEEEERDLDAEVPEAEEMGDDSDEGSNDADMTFNEESLMEGSIDGEGREELEMEDAELAGRLQDERDLGLERDLDDSVPEAGSYEHTDTEAEDNSSEEEATDDELVARPPNLMRQLGGEGRSRGSMISEPSEIMGSSSFVSSSPAMGRGNAFRGRAMSRRGRFH